MKKKILITIGVVLGVALLGLFITVAQMFSLFEKAEKPEIREGSFDFCLTYELDGKKEVIEGTMVCEFKGIKRAIDGYGRMWEDYIVGHEDGCVYEIKETPQGKIMLDLDLSALFFMSDPNYKITDNTDVYKPEPHLYVLEEEEGEEDVTGSVTLSEYRGDEVKIISFTYDEPIENVYK